MLYYTAPIESYPMSYETAQTLKDLADAIADVQSAISAKSIYRLANSEMVTSEDIESLYRKEVRLSQINPLAAELIYDARLDLAQPFSNGFYKNPETGFNAPTDEA